MTSRTVLRSVPDQEHTKRVGTRGGAPYVSIYLVSISTCTYVYRYICLCMYVCMYEGMYVRYIYI